MEVIIVDHIENLELYQDPGNEPQLSDEMSAGTVVSRTHLYVNRVTEEHV